MDEKILPRCSMDADFICDDLLHDYFDNQLRWNMRLEQSEGYIMALKDIKKIIEDKIMECEYALCESYTNMYRDTYPEELN